MSAKVIFIEGLPNSGKSTVLDRLGDTIESMGFKVNKKFETDLDNPLDNHCNAFVTNEEYQELVDKYDHERDQLDEVAEDFMAGKIIRYWKHRALLIPELYEDLQEKDFFNLPLETYQILLDTMWEKFITEVRGSEAVYLVECAMIQNPMHIALLRDNVPLVTFEDRVLELCHKVKDLDCSLIYVDHSCVDQIFMRRALRSIGWQNANLQEYTCGNAFGRERQYSGQEGLKAAYQDLYKIQRALLDKLEIRTQRLDNSDYHADRLLNDIQAIAKTIMGRTTT